MVKKSALEDESDTSVDAALVSPGAGLRALRERLGAGGKRGTVRLTRALTLLEAEYERVAKGAAPAAAPAADDSAPEE